MHTSSELVCASFRRTSIDSSLQLQVEVEMEVGKKEYQACRRSAGQ